jgi:UDP-glucose 4-epimerase
VRDQDFVIHAAAQLGVEACFAQPSAVEAVNVIGTTNITEAVRRHKPARLLFLSSSEIYGDGKQQPFSEDDTPAPKTLYGRTKVTGESLVRALTVTSGIPSTIVRLFNVYGPHQKDEFVIPRFIRQALERTPITIYGDGSQIRSFTYVDDAARGIVCALTRDAAGGACEVFNIGRREPTSILELARLIRTTLGSDCDITTSLDDEKAKRIAAQEIHYRVPDVTKAERLLGFTATTPLTAGIEMTAAAMTVI